MWNWGYGFFGQLGDGNFYINPPNSVATPVLASSLGQPMKAIAAGGDHSLALPATPDTPPAITCPTDFTVNNDPGQCLAVVNYPDPAVTGIGATVVCNPPSGSTFPVGTHIVTCTATDAGNLTATCSFNVTVHDTEPPLIVCPADMTVNADPGQCGVAADKVSLGTPSVSDNCGVASVVLRRRIRFGVGTTILTWNVSTKAVDVIVPN